MNGPKLLSTGRQAVECIAKVMPTAPTITVRSSLGDVELRPGTIFSNRKILVYPSPMTVYYAVDDRLYEEGTALFVRGEYLNAMSAGAARAMPMVHLAKAEIALLTGIFVPWYGMLGLTAAKVGLLYSAHKKEFDSALQKAPAALRTLLEVRRRYPELFRRLMLTSAKEFLVNLPNGVTAEDVAFFLGRVIKGAGGVPELTLGQLAKVVARVAVVVGSLHAPSMAARGMASAAATNAAALKAQLAAQGLRVSQEEANVILREILADPKGVERLRELENACNELAPVLRCLTAAIRSQ
ncbi:MAG: hypothetical protein KIT09_15780 [Bryobacteraceae bacterium]|nr:hypothetical protein [Bryobacteraceae bacterium]